MVTNDECDLSNVIMIIEVLHIKTPICTRITISKDRLAIFTNYPSVTKDQTRHYKKQFSRAYSTLCTVHGCFQFTSITTEDTIARHDVVKGQLSKVGVQGFSAH